MSSLTRDLLDTTALIDLSKEREPVASDVRALLRGPDEVGVCAVNVAEFFSGLRPGDRPRWEAFIDSIKYWDLSKGIAIQAGIYRYDYARRGRTIAAPDSLIAATAASVGAILVTNNVKDYPMPEVRLLRLGR